MFSSKSKSTSAAAQQTDNLTVTPTINFSPGGGLFGFLPGALAFAAAFVGGRWLFRKGK